MRAQLTGIFGFDQDELVGEPVASYFHPDDRDSVIAAFERVVTSVGQSVEAVEYRHEQADGTYRWVESVGSPNPTPNGNYVINTRDIEERKQREQSLRKTNKRLDEFAHVVSHDLRNPLGVAQGNLEFARQECESQYLDRVEAAHERMETLMSYCRYRKRVGRLKHETTSESVQLLSSVGYHCHGTRVPRG